MRTRFYIFLSVIVSLVISFSGKGAHVSTVSLFSNHTIVFQEGGTAYGLTNITDLDKRPNSDRLRIRTKANVDTWEITLPTEWHYTPPGLFLYNEQRYHDQQSAVLSNYLLSATLRGPPAIAAFLPLV